MRAVPVCPVLARTKAGSRRWNELRIAGFDGHPTPD
jgi:hypothetical protein